MKYACAGRAKYISSCGEEDDIGGKKPKIAFSVYPSIPNQFIQRESKQLRCNSVGRTDNVISINYPLVN